MCSLCNPTERISFFKFFFIYFIFRIRNLHVFQDTLFSVSFVLKEEKKKPQVEPISCWPRISFLKHFSDFLRIKSIAQTSEISSSSLTHYQLYEFFFFYTEKNLNGPRKWWEQTLRTTRRACSKIFISRNFPFEMF